VKNQRTKKSKDPETGGQFSAAGGPPRIGVFVVAGAPSADETLTRNLTLSVEKGIRLAGAECARFLFSGPGLVHGRDGHSCRFPRRDLWADEVECAAMSAGLDGLVLCADGNDAAAGLLLGAVRLNKPALFVPLQGSQVFPDPRAALAADALSATAKQLARSRTVPTGFVWPHVPADPALDDYPSHAVACLSEVLGASLPLSSTVPTGSGEQMNLAASAGQRAVDLVRQNLSIRRLLMVNAFLNAARLDAAFGGFSEALVFLLALAHEAGVKLSLEVLADVERKTPQICRLHGEASHHLKDLHGAGGIPAVLAAFKGLWLPHSTVSGRGINELAKSVRVRETRVIRSGAPYRAEGGVVVLKGNLAPQGALFRVPPEFPSKMGRFLGTVKVFDSREDALKALLEKKIVKGDLVVVRYEGPRGGPGLRPLGLLAHVLAAQGLTDTVGLLTDGAWGNALPSGLAVEFSSPEATEGAALSVLRDGDRVDVDLSTRRLNVHLTDTEMKVRLARWHVPPGRARNGFLARYVRSVGPVLEGAVLK